MSNQSKWYWSKNEYRKDVIYLSDLTGNGELRVSLRSLAGPVPCRVIKYVLKVLIIRFQNEINNNMNNNKMSNNQLFLLMHN